MSPGDVQIAFGAVQKLQRPITTGGYRLTADEARVVLALLKAGAAAQARERARG